MEELIKRIKREEDYFRFKHTISVAKECLKLAQIFGLSEKENKQLYISALLHDITKGLPIEEQLRLAEKYNIVLSDDDLASPAILHSLTGAAVALNEYADYTDETVSQIIETHTTGRENMTLQQKLLYLADFIEPTRKYENCKALRKYFYSHLRKSNDKNNVLNKTILRSYEMTVNHLTQKGNVIHPTTLNAQKSLENK